MSCPTCSHTLDTVVAVADGAIYHCPRCGTMVGTYGDGSACVPKLVERCRIFEARGLTGPRGEEWRRLGIAEAINPPGQRP